jgi:hypothetical protein
MRLHQLRGHERELHFYRHQFNGRVGELLSRRGPSEQRHVERQDFSLVLLAQEAASAFCLYSRRIA